MKLSLALKDKQDVVRERGFGGRVDPHDLLFLMGDMFQGQGLEFITLSGLEASSLSSPWNAFSLLALILG